MKGRVIAGAGWATPATLEKGPNGRALCRYCGVEVQGRRVSFCSGERATFAYRTGFLVKPGHGCVHEHCLRSDPGYARACVYGRDLGRCQECGLDTGEGIPHGKRSGALWQADHIVPVVEGGGACGLENLRTLCTRCHRSATAALAKRRAEARRKLGT